MASASGTNKRKRLRAASPARSVANSIDVLLRKAKLSKSNVGSGDEAEAPSKARPRAKARLRAVERAKCFGLETMRHLKKDNEHKTPKGILICGCCNKKASVPCLSLAFVCLGWCVFYVSLYF